MHYATSNEASHLTVARLIVKPLKMSKAKGDLDMIETL